MGQGPHFPLAKRGVKLYLKREPRHLRLTDTGAGTARFAPPCTVATAVLFFDPDPLQWAGVNCYSAIDAENRTKATAISRMKTVRMADALLFRLRRAGRMVEGQPCMGVIACSFRDDKWLSEASLNAERGKVSLPPQNFAKR